MLQVSKYQGLGNDFLMLDGRSASEAEFCFGLSPDLIRRLCDRRFGVGADGIIVALPPRGDGELRMRIFNADGTEPEMCGNGIRCLARFLADSDGDSPGRRWQIETLAGRIVPELRDGGTIQVDMGPPFLEPATIPTTLPVGACGLPEGELEVEGMVFAVAAAGMGNPHVVIPVNDVASVDLVRYGAALEVHPVFPARTNVHFVQILQPDHLVMRVWERGAGPTLACGTGACATLVVAHALGLAARSARVDLPGGPLQITWDQESNHVLMTGPAEAVFEAVVVPDLSPPLAASLVDPASAAERLPADPTGPDPCPAPVEPPLAVGVPSPVPASSAVAAVNCAVACVQGCQQPDNCPSAEARARVEALLSSSSLDDLVALASDSLETRTRSRLERDRSSQP
ncbi:MAG: diaminopimelate epimerase [Cyanobacteriota bacterium]